MTVRVLEITLPPAELRTQRAFEVRVLIEVDGDTSAFAFTVTDLGLRSSDARLVSASPPFVERFRSTPATLRHVEALVGQAIAGSAVHLPQLVAA